MAADVTERLSARDRLLASANELFYREGVHTVGIDRVIAHAGVAKATLYNAFGSKDGLITAYLRGRNEISRERILRHVSCVEDPRESLLAVFDALGESIVQPGFHGCALVNASAEASAEGPIHEAAAEHRDWLRRLFVDLSRDAGAGDPERLAGQLVLLYDGASISARMDDNLTAAASARVVAEVLVGGAISR
jgi:AcrR family transcriptional regulator